MKIQNKTQKDPFPEMNKAYGYLDPGPSLPNVYFIPDVIIKLTDFPYSFTKSLMDLSYRYPNKFTVKSEHIVLGYSDWDFKKRHILPFIQGVEGKWILFKENASYDSILDLSKKIEL